MITNPSPIKPLVMIDGRSIYSDVQGVVFWKLLPITVPEIKRIEIPQGSCPVCVWVSTPLTVINIITSPQR